MIPGNADDEAPYAPERDVPGIAVDLDATVSESQLAGSAQTWSPERGEPDPHPVPDWARDAAPEDLAPALEAVCFALNRPITLGEAAAILGRSRTAVAAAAEIVAAELRRRGLMLQRHQDEIQLVTRPEVAWAVQRALNPARAGRLSRAALETLAIVAYRQPATRATVESIRGVNSDGVLDSLERRELVTEVGRQETPGRPRLYGTTLRFLQVVGLERIEDLPALADGERPALTAATFGLSIEPGVDEDGGPGDGRSGAVGGADVPVT